MNVDTNTAHLLIDQSQRLRRTRVLMAFAVYVTAWLMILIAKTQGLSAIPWDTLWGMAGLAIILCSFFIWMIRSGINQKFRDHSLTQLQMTAAILWSVPFFYYGPQVRAEGLMVYFVVFFFGIFRLNRRQLLMQGLIVVLLYIGVLLYESSFVVGAVPTREWLRVTFLSMALIVIAWLGGEQYITRQRLKEKHQALVRANQLISKQATHDSLTGLYNRHYLMDNLQREEARHRRMGSDLSVILCDIDHFKALNDRFGHIVGDDVLKSVAENLQQLLRQSDAMALANDNIVARFGGEEFVILLPDTPLEGARLCAERLREAVSHTRFASLPEDVKVTISFGVAQMRISEKHNEMLQRADDALYEAKHSGRNKVCVALG